MKPGAISALVAVLTVGAMAAMAAEPPLTAVVAHLSGDATIVSGPAGAGRVGAESLYAARPFRVLGQGDEIVVPKGAGLAVVCSDDRLVRLQGPVRRTVGPALCRAGIAAPGAYRAVAPVAGRLRAMAGGALTLERQARGIEEEDPTIPVVLAPRWTAVREGRPAIVWRGVERAVEYQVELNGGDWTPVSLDASEVACTSDPAGLVDGPICSRPWPAGQPGLAPGQVAFVTVRARTSLAGPWRAAPEASRLSRLPTREAEAVASRLAAFSKLPESAVRRLLEAGAAADAGLPAEALEACRDAVAVGGPPEARVALGDLYLGMDLVLPAARSYQAALTASEDPAVHAAAELGLGLVERARRSTPAARGHLKRARDLYRAAGFAAEAAEAERLLASLSSSGGRGH